MTESDFCWIDSESMRMITYNTPALFKDCSSIFISLQDLRSKNLSCWSLSNSKLKIEVKINSINYVRVLKSYQIIPNDKKDIGAILFISWIMTKIHSRQSFKGQLIFTPFTSWPLLRDFIAWKLISNQFACVFRAYAIWLYYRILA